MKFIKKIYWNIYAYFAYTRPDKKIRKEYTKKYPDYDDSDDMMYMDMIMIHNHM